MPYRLHVLAGLGCCVLLIEPVLAQQAVQPSGSATAAAKSPTVHKAAKTTHAGGGSEEVVVTAERRASTVQRTPISMTVITGKALQARGLTSVEAVAAETPGVSFKTGGPGQTEFEMRGLSSTGGESPTVGFYVDDTPITSFGYATAGKVVIDPNLYDLNRIEVLRGPQGTLYGSGSMGGTIRLITDAPDPEAVHGSVEAIGSGTEGGAGNYTGNIMANLPLIRHRVALRVSATDKWVSGWIARDILSPFPLPGNDLATRGDVTGAPLAAAHDNVNWERLRGVRVSALIQLTDALTILPSYMEQRITQGGQNLIDSPPGDVEAHYQPFDLAEPVLDSFNLYSLNMRYAFGPFDLTSQTSRWTHDLRQTQDGSEVLQSVLDLPGYDLADGGIGTSPWVETDYSRQLSQELRVTSTYPSPLQWQFGAFYSDFSSTNYQTGRAPGGAALFGITNLYTQNIVQPIQQVAGFGQASYRILPSLTFTAGLRYYDFMSSNDATQSGLFGPNGDNTPRNTQTGRIDTGFNPKFTLAWLPNPDLTVYSTISRGFRPGGGNEVVPTVGPDSCAAALASLGKTSAPLTFGADHVWNYELGEKARLLGGRVTVNAAGYYEDWADVQKFISLSCGYIYNDNAGSAQVYGGELETGIALAAGLNLTESLGYTHATYTTDNLEAGITAGQTLTDAPRWVSSTALTYTRPVTPKINSVTRYVNDYTSTMTDITYATNDVPVRDIMSIRTGLVSGPWSAWLFVDNLTNKHAILTNISSIVLNIPSINRAATNQPRTIGLDLSYGF